MLVAVAAVVGLWLFERERRRSGLPNHTLDAGMAGVFGGLAGAKVVWAIEHMGREGPFFDLLISRGGLSWFGGFAGGLVAGLLVMRHHRLPILRVLAAATPALAIAHAIGRVGCFLVGDDYGVPSDLPWAVAFPGRPSAHDNPGAPDAALRDVGAAAPRVHAPAMAPAPAA